MQFKSLATILFATMAVASPAPVPQSDDSSIDMNDLFANVPNSIMAVMATAVPASFISAMADPTSVSSIVSEIEAGTYPAWYSSLPDSVKAWATSAALAELGLDASATATDVSSAGSTATATGVAATATNTSSGSSSSASGTVSSAQTTASSSTSGSQSASAGASSTSSHNAGATGAVAMSFAGAAGLLAVALAL